jgi:hypothetical protein
MNTYYVRFVQQGIDPVWGLQALPWVQTGLVRVTRNSLRKAVFEWVGCPCLPFDLEQVRKSYPIAMYADLPNSGSDLHDFRKVSPLPKWVSAHPPRDKES